MEKHCYAIVNERGNLLIEDGKLPIYWSKKAAEERVAKFPRHRLEPVLLKDLRKFILTHPF